ncbi:MAG: hypothetical protein IPJ97_18475, partial [Proteobacteria bacterium]|nr:hypothetical protein [Pseudomonadota bacterium]
MDDADRRADVFSLSAMMRNCLSLTAGEAYQPTATDPVVKGLGAVLGKATATAATDRFATALDLAAELRRLRVGESVLTGRAGPIARAMQRILRNRWPVTAAVLLTALLATALISWSDTLRARRRSDAAAERGSALLANLAENWGTSRQADLTAAGSVRSDHATSEGLAARIDLEVGRILRRAGQESTPRASGSIWLRTTRRPRPRPVW